MRRSVSHESALYQCNNTGGDTNECTAMLLQRTHSPLATSVSPTRPEPQRKHSPPLCEQWQTHIANCVNETVRTQLADIECALDESLERKIEIALSGSDENSDGANRHAETAQREAENKYLAAFEARRSDSGCSIPIAPNDSGSVEERQSQYAALIARVASDFKRTFFQEWSANLRAQRPFMNAVQRNFLQNMIAERFKYMEGAWRTQVDALMRDNSALRQKLESLEHAFLQHSVSTTNDQCRECDKRRSVLQQAKQQSAALESVLQHTPPSPLSSPPPDGWPVTLQHDAFVRSPTPP